MNSLIKYFIKFPITGDLVMIAILLAGVIGMFNLRSNFFPETPTKTISVQIVYPGASPEEIEEGVVAKIEDNLKGVAGLDQVKSVCTENSATITIDVLDEGKTDEKLQDVKNAVDRISSFPVGMEPPIIYKQESIGFAISFAVAGDLSLTDLKRTARGIESDLRAQDGISQVSLSGFPDEEIQVAVDEQRLLELGINFNEVSLAIRAANLETTGGKIRTDREELLIRGRFKEYRAYELRDIVVRAEADGRVIRLGEIAEVTDRWSDNDPSRNWFNGQPAAVVTVNNLLEEDIIGITEKVRQYIDDFNTKNSDVTLHVIRDQSVVLNQRIDLLVNNGIVGFLLVVFFLALFLNSRLAFWVALAIPVSFAGMFIFAGLLGVTINVISLFGMILVIGILVDDGIVIAESIYQKYEEGYSRYDATIKGTLEVLPAVFSAIVTTMVAFSMFFFIEGRLGDFFREMAIVVMVTLVFSLVEGALILPAHVGHSKALARDRKQNKLEKTMKGVMDWLRNTLYAPVLRFSMKLPFITFGIVVAVFAITVPGMIGGGFVKTTFFPFIEGDNITVNLTMGSGTRDYITTEALDRIEAAAWEVSEELSAQRDDSLQLILAVDKRIGPSTYQGTINIQLLDGEARNMKVLEVTDMIRQRVGPIYGADNISFATFSPFGRPVSVSLLGNDLDELTAAADALREEMEKRDDLKDVIDNNRKGLKEVNIRLKPNATLLGLNEQEVLSQLRQGYFGSEVQRLQRGEDEVRVWLRYSEDDRSSVGDLSKIRIRTVTGLEVPLDEVAELDVKRGVVAINRLYGKREVQVSADLADANVSASDANGDIRENVVPEILSNYPSVSVSYEGQNREQLKSQQSIGQVLPLILAIMVFIIMLTFRSPIQGLVVVSLIPFGLIGVSLGHWVLDAQISLFSVLGMIALIGILVNDALVFVAAFNTNIKNRMDFREALWAAGMSRFRPIVLTSVTTIAGLGPLILNKSFQAQFLIPMAIAVAFGLLFVTLIILVLLPAFMIWANWLHGLWQWVIKGTFPPPNEREPALREVLKNDNFQADE
ncbi:efflux RND transporter permease subunit [Sanyastnella coralliicola]|uniref:efflux RND transporter permease subunit n=1 Tax=Sanyastnella coralliicola TaxID=3069118 RepID=UPI0027BA41F6|nr:efflux RND transporter permease subunit [Longitalea sp. SCSIO 12813]